jgi:hypothetical protein
VAPDTGEVVEVGLAVALAVGIVPEADRHARHGRGDDQLAELVDHRVTGGVVRLDPGAQGPAGDPAFDHREQGHRTDEARADIRTAGKRLQLQARAHRLVDPVETLRRQRRAGRADALEPVFPRGEAGLAAGHEEGRGRAEIGDAGFVDQIPEDRHARVRGVAVEHDDRGADGGTAGQEVPHHPAGGGEPEEPVTGAQVVVQGEHLEVFEQDAAVTVDDRLGQAGGPRAVEHVERMVERHLLVRHRVVATELAERVAGGIEVADGDDVPQRRERRGDGRDLLAPVDGLVAVAVAVDGHEQRRFDLLPAVDHTAYAEFGRARREDGAEAGGGEHQHVRLGNVGRVGRHPVAAADAVRQQPRANIADLLTKLGRGQGDRRTGLAVGEHDRLVVGQPGHAQDVLGVVDGRAGEPLRPRHPGAPGQHTRRRVVGDDLEVVPDRLPERGQVVDGPLPERRVIRELQAARPLQP